MIDVLVVGGGPAGATAARLLGEAGLKVELYERCRMPREKPCGEGIMPAGVRALARWGLLDAVGGARIEGVRYRLGDVVAEGRFPEGRGLGQRRYVLDRVLFEAAARTVGVAAREGVAVDGPIVEGGRVVGMVARGEARRARLVLAADGLRSPLRRALGLERPTAPPGRASAPPQIGARPRVGVRAHFRLAAGAEEAPWVEVYVGRGHELYVTPLPEGELLVAGLAEAGELRGGAGAALERWVAGQPHLAARLRGAERITPVQGRSPLAATATVGWVPGCVLLGDAAGYLDPITGGGITQALLTAELLTDYAAAMAAGDVDAFVAFEARRAALLRDYHVLTRGVLALARHPHLAEAAVRLLAHTPSFFEHLVGVAAGTHRLAPSPSRAAA